MSDTDTIWEFINASKQICDYELEFNVILLNPSVSRLYNYKPEHEQLFL